MLFKQGAFFPTQGNSPPYPAIGEQVEKIIQDRGRRELVLGKETFLGMEKTCHEYSGDVQTDSKVALIFRIFKVFLKFSEFRSTYLGTA